MTENAEIHGRAASVSVQIAFASYNFASFVFAAETVVEAVAKAMLENGADGVDNVRSWAGCHCWKRKLRKVFFAVLFPNLKQSIKFVKKIRRASIRESQKKNLELSTNVLK